ncbi:MAG: hypothetical protein G3I09_07560, partial [Ferrovum sp.]|nr:hypothetical protein [Ferrovum sp.]
MMKRSMIAVLMGFALVGSAHADGWRGGDGGGWRGGGEGDGAAWGMGAA